MPEAQPAVAVTPQAPAAPAAPEQAQPKAEGTAPPETAAQKTGTEATPAAPEAKPETPEQAAKRESRRFERRIDKATRRAGEAEAKAELYRRQLEAFQQSQSRPEQDGAPRLENFDDVQKYAKAVAEFEKKQTLKEVETRQREAAQQQFQQSLTASWEEKVEKVIDDFEDFNTVVGPIAPTTPLSVAIMEADPKVAYYLGKNENEAKRLIGMNPLKAILEIGRLEAKLLTEPAKPKTPSKAPAPITPLTGASPATATSLYDKNLSDKEWFKLREQQIKEKRQARR